jgi:hypothetical protein
MNPIRNYSTNININNYSLHKINDFKTLYILPNIYLDDAFCLAFLKVLLTLDPDTNYSLELCACLHTNNKNKKFIPNYPGMNGIYNNSNEHYIKYLKFRDSVTSLFKYKGYVNVLSNSFNINELENGVEEYVYTIFSFTRDNIFEYAGFDLDKPSKQWIEYKKPVILIINKI